MDYANDREEIKDIKDIKNSHEPTHTIHMTKEQIIARCKEKEQQLLNRYFGSLIDEAASERPETIGEYTKNLPLEIAAEFRKFLKELWEEVAPEAEKGKEGAIGVPCNHKDCGDQGIGMERSEPNDYDEETGGEYHMHNLSQSYFLFL